MLSPADQLAALPQADRSAFLKSLTEPEAEDLLYRWRGFLARPDQLAPDGDWDTWLILAGRGWGKTRTGAEWVKEQEASGARSIALIGETYADARQVMVEGTSGILGCYADSDPNRPEYFPSQKKLIWPSGAVAWHFDAREPGQLRGPQFDRAWADELAKWRYARETWDMLQFGLRLGDHPRVVVTTTPRPIDLVREMMAREGRGVAVTRGRTKDNRANLAASFITRIEERYAGTRLGRQELEAEILDDAPGALWTRRCLDENRVSEMPPLKRVVVAVDPPATEGGDEAGIVAAGLGEDDPIGYVIEDHSSQGRPEHWARKAVALYRQLQADRIVIEVNQGGDMVESVIRSVDPNVAITQVRASRGKHVRAEPVSALYEQGRIKHVGAFPTLEDQMVLMTSHGYEGERSPDRLDALVWAVSDLFEGLVRPEPKIDWSKRFTGAGSANGWMGA